MLEGRVPPRGGEASSQSNPKFSANAVGPFHTSRRNLGFHCTKAQRRFPRLKQKRKISSKAWWNHNADTWSLSNHLTGPKSRYPARTSHN